MVGLDVRVPDARAGDARARRRPAAGRQPAPRCASSRPSARRRACPGACRSRPTSRRTIRWPTSTRPSACRGWRCAARRRPTAWSRPMPALMAAHVRAAARRWPTCAGSKRWARAASSASSMRSTSPSSRQPEGAALQRGAQLHGAPPGHVAGGAVQRAVRRRAAPLVRQRRRWSQAHESLLHERTPRQIIGSADPRTPPEPSDGATGAGCSSRAWSTRPRRAGSPRTCCRTAATRVALRANGAGVSRWRAFNVTRWRDDLLRDGYGTFFYLRDDGQPRAHLAHRPARARRRLALPRPLPGRPGAVRCAGRRPGGAHHGADQPRGRHRAAHRHAAQHRRRDAHAGARVVLRAGAVRPASADEAHPAFANLFVADALGCRAGAPCCCRASRACTATRSMAVAHFLAVGRCPCAVGRLHGRPARLHRPQPHARRRPRCDAQPLGADGAPVNGLDPIACLRVRLRIAPGATARLTFATAAADSTSRR